MIGNLNKKLLLLLLCVPLIGLGQTRYLDDVFTNVHVTELDTFAVNISIEPMLFGLPPQLLPIECDIYQPTGDTVTNRPVIILCHGGFFLPPVANGEPIGSIKDSSIVEQCTRWAKKGYVAVAMNNRLGWNPTSTNQNVRTSTLLQATYRGIQDAKAMVRFMRMTEDSLGNPFGIDPNKIVLGGQGTGAYIALGYATLDDAAVELNLPKFIDFSNPSDPSPYVVPYFFGNIDGTDLTFAPAYDTLGNMIPIIDSSGNILGFQVDSTMPLNIPTYNNPTYSNDINMAFNIGGALADISWLEAGDVPIVSFHCANDPYNPIDTGDVIVPTTGDFVVEVMGSRTVQHYSNQYGNNDVFINAGFTDVYTTAANMNNSGYEGLYVFQTPPPSNTPNAFGELEDPQSAPWDWWDNVSYDQMFTAIHGPIVPAGYGAAHSLLGNPDMSAAKGRSYIDTIQGYLNPRIYTALNLGSTINTYGCTDSTALNYDSTATIDDSSCVYCNLIVSVVVDSASCFGNCDGSASVSVVGGTPGYSYSWNDPLSQTTATAIGLCAGTYTCIVIDATGCTDTLVSVAVASPNFLNISFTSTDVLCNGGNDGTATVTAQGGVLPYSYLWSNGDIIQTANNLSAGTHTVSVTDAQGCYVSSNVIISQATPIVSTTTIINHSSCAGSQTFANGEAQVLASQGTPGYSYEWTGPISPTWPIGYTGNGTYNDLLWPGTYIIKITDDTGCIHYDTAIINPGVNPILDPTIVNISCYGANNGTITTGAVSGTPPYLFSYDGFATPGVPFGNVTGPTSPIGLFMTVVDAEGCTDSDSVFVVEPSLIMWQQSFSICDGDNVIVGSSIYNTTGNYIDTLTASNSCDSIVYTNIIVDYNTSSYDTLSVTASIVWNGLPLSISGDYFVILVNSAGCDSIVNLNLTVNTTGVLDISSHKRTLIKIANILGQETPYRKNTPLFYIYNDGTVEKKIIIE